MRVVMRMMLLALLPMVLLAQSITTSSVSGTVSDKDGNPLAGCNVVATHEASGTVYGASTQENGKFTIPGMRVGGPYTVAVSFIGYEEQKKEGLFLSLGVVSNLHFVLKDAYLEGEQITVLEERDAVFSAERTGAATSIQRETLEALPTISRRIVDMARLTPQYNPAGFGFSFAGQDNRLNNMTVDGSYFNNSFGLSGQPGDRTGVSPISLDAIEQVQVNVAPYDVRQGNFVGAGVNTVTKSGTNEFSGSVYYQYRDEGMVGTKARDIEFDPGTFEYNQVGFRLSGPIIKNKLFFFVSYENDKLTSPGTTFTANDGTQEVKGNTTRVLASDLDALSTYLNTNFNYETGPYQGYNHNTPATRLLARLDYNLDNSNKISFRYNQLISDTDVLLSNSSSLGFGTRRTNLNGLNYQNSNYIIMENIHSLIGEWNSQLSSNMANNLILGYTTNDESRDSRGEMFPMVDILNGSTVYTTFGFEPFTPNNELRYNSLQLQDNFMWYLPNHTLTFGASLEKYESENVFFPGSQSVYVYNSLADFYTDANDYLANPDRTVSPVTLKRFQVRWSNQPDQEKPVQPLKVLYTGVYGQDEFKLSKDFNVMAGLRIDVPSFENTGFKNAEVASMKFLDENGDSVQYKTDKLPDANLLFSPRVGFNWDVLGNRTTQVRGGSGVFTGRPAYVWISNQIGNNGVLTGFERLDNTTSRPFNPNIDHYKPGTVTGDPASSYELAFTDPDFKFPQVWRTNLAVDQKIPFFGLVGTAEFLYTKDVNGVYYINANQTTADSSFNGVDDRERWVAGRKINSKIDNAIVLKNQDKGYSWNFSATLEKPFSNGLYGKAGYSYGVAKNTVDAGSIAFGSWNNNQHSGNANDPGLGFSAYSSGNRVFGALSYHVEYFNLGGTTVSLFVDGYNQGNFSYVFSGDMNGDGGTSNDLIYIHKNKDEMNFEEYSISYKDADGNTVSRTFTAAEQAEAWDKFIKQDDYLSEHRGEYAERGGAILPMVYRADLSITQEVFTNVLNKRNSLQLRLDLLNFTNLLNKNWGVGQAPITTRPLVPRTADAEGKSLYRLTTVNNELISKSLDYTAGTNDVFRILLSLRYNFN